MINQYYTLKKIVRELQFLEGCELVECFTQEKNSVLLVFSGGGETRNLAFSADPKNSSLFVKESFARARKNTVDLFPDLLGDVAQNVRLLAGDRIVEISLIRSDLIFKVFGGANDNLYATSKNGRIIDALNSKEADVGEKLILPKNKLKNIDDFAPKTKIADALARAKYLLGKAYALEVCSMADVAPDKKIKDIPQKEIGGIDKLAATFAKRLDLAELVFILENGDGEKILSLAPLKSYPETAGVFDSASAAVGRILAARHKEGSVSKKKSAHRKTFERIAEKSAAALQEIANEEKSRERADRYALWAELLASNPQPKSKPGEKIELTGWDGEPLEIPLDPKLNIIDNAAKYFEKAKSTRARFAERAKLAPELKRKLSLAEKALEELANIENIKELNIFEKRMNDEFGIGGKSSKSNDAKGRFREFELGGGFRLYVGKSAANNDELTMKFAKPNDLWLHARGAAGSHAVLRLEKNQKPGKDILKKAAAVAAYYSQARKAKHVPVAYTYKKYVRKPKGANQGAVVMAKEDVIMVDPALPEGDGN